MSTLHVLTPTYNPVGGVVKIMDYVGHARAADYEVVVHCPSSHDPTLPVWRIERFGPLLEDPAVRFISDLRVGLGPEDFAFVSLPTQYREVGPRLTRGMSPERIIHIVQNVRHTNPTWLDGYPLRLLTRPVARITTNAVVQEAIAPFLNPTSVCRIIPLGHPAGYFHKERSGGLHRRIRVGYTTWKSEVGDEVADTLSGSDFRFRAIRQSVGWEELRELYHWCDVFLGCPNPEEGFYMPAFEAMEAGAVVIVPDAGGNRAFCRFGENCLRAELDDADSYVARLREVAGMSPSELDAMRAAAREALVPFDLAAERRRFVRYMADLEERVEATEAGELDPRRAGRGPVDDLLSVGAPSG